MPGLGARKLRDLRAEDIDKWLASKSSTLSTSTLQRLHSCLNRAINRAMARDRIRRARGRGRQVNRGRAGADHRGGAAGAQRDRAMTPIFAIDTRGARFG